MSVLVAIVVGIAEFRENLSVAGGADQDMKSRTAFLRSLQEKGLDVLPLLTRDRCLGASWMTSPSLLNYVKAEEVSLHPTACCPHMVLIADEFRVE